jgi:hypothetical protein
VTVITMSRNELTRLRVLIGVAYGRLSVAGSTGLIGVGRKTDLPASGRVPRLDQGSRSVRCRRQARPGFGTRPTPGSRYGLNPICPYSVTVR